MSAQPGPAGAHASAREVAAPVGWRCLDFISDLHLAESTPRAFALWRHYLLNTAADAVFILGDLFDAWVGDDAREAGFEAEGAAVLREAAAQRSLWFMVGNRDFLLGAAMLDACGVHALPDPTVLSAFGERVLLVHGDAWCIGDVDYQRFRRQVRDPAWQRQVLARPLAERRAMASGMRSESERKASEQQGEWFDVDRATALGSMAAHRTPTLVHGHTHRPATELLDTGFVRHVLSDWELDHEPGATRAEVLRWSAGNRWSRLAPADAAGALTNVEAARSCPPG